MILNVRHNLCINRFIRIDQHNGFTMLTFAEHFHRRNINTCLTKAARYPSNNPPDNHDGMSK